MASLSLTRISVGGGLRALASLRLTLVAIAWLVAAVALIYDRAGEAGATLPLVPPLALLALNLFAAILTNGSFRRQLHLLVFHLALLAIVLLAALGRLTYLRGTAEVVTGSELQELQRVDAGPWHRGDRERLHFENLGFRIDYKPGLKRDRTLNRVRWRDAAGLPHEEEIGDQVPLVLEGYRFYTTPNKGYAALFEWHPYDGPVELGSVSFPSYPSRADDQTSRWSVGGQVLAARLVLADSPLDAATDSQFRLPEQHAVQIQSGMRELRLQPGGTMLLASGRLVYRGLTTWMGYSVFYDWTVPWLLAACLLATAALAWHFWSRFAARPWRPD